MSLREDILPTLDDLRSIADSDEIGIRLYTVTMRVTTWTPPSSDTSDIQLGRGTSTVVDTQITVGGGARPKVRRVKYKETIAGGGKYQEGDFRIGPLTPEYPGGGVPFSLLAPTGTGDGRTHYHTILKGPDLPPGGMLCSPVAEEADRAFSRYLVVRPEGVVPR
jgi:hypothetical protein